MKFDRLVEQVIEEARPKLYLSPEQKERSDQIIQNLLNGPYGEELKKIPKMGGGVSLEYKIREELGIPLNDEELEAFRRYRFLQNITKYRKSPLGLEIDRKISKRYASTEKGKATIAAYKQTQAYRDAMERSKAKRRQEYWEKRGMKKEDVKPKALYVYKDGNLVATLYGRKEWIDFGLEPANVNRTLRGEQANHKGYTFKRETED